MARSRKHHEERKRRAKERADRKARQEREKLSPTSLVDRDKSLPAPPPELSPNPSITPNTLSPVIPQFSALIVDSFIRSSFQEPSDGRTG